MANVNHSTLTDPYLHEPKGIASAGAGNVYVSDGAGSGTWTKDHSHINGYLAFDATTPAYTHSVLAGFTPLNPTFNMTNADGFSGLSSPNARLQYDDSNNSTAFLTFSFNYKNSSGADRDLEIAFYKNGTITNAHQIVTAVRNQWRSSTLSETLSLSTNDYIEIFVKGDSSFTLEVACASLIIHGVPA